MPCTSSTTQKTIRSCAQNKQELVSCVLPALDMGCFSCLFASHFVLLVRDDGSMLSQKVREVMLRVIPMRIRLPRIQAGLFAPIPQRIDHYSTGWLQSAIRTPGWVGFLEHKGPLFIRLHSRMGAVPSSRLVTTKVVLKGGI